MEIEFDELMQGGLPCTAGHAGSFDAGWYTVTNLCMHDTFRFSPLINNVAVVFENRNRTVKTECLFKFWVYDNLERDGAHYMPGNHMCYSN